MKQLDDKKYVKQIFAMKWDHYLNDTQKFAAQIAKEVVHPFCDKNRLHFRSGMGSWNFSSWSKGIPLEIEYFPAIRYQKMFDLLTTLVEGFNMELGALLNDYNYDPFKEANTRKGDQE